MTTGSIILESSVCTVASALAMLQTASAMASAAEDWRAVVRASTAACCGSAEAVVWKTGGGEWYVGLLLDAVFDARGFSKGN